MCYIVGSGYGCKNLDYMGIDDCTSYSKWRKYQKRREWQFLSGQCLPTYHCMPYLNKSTHKLASLCTILYSEGWNCAGTDTWISMIALKFYLQLNISPYELSRFVMPISSLTDVLQKHTGSWNVLFIVVIFGFSWLLLYQFTFNNSLFRWLLIAAEW